MALIKTEIQKLRTQCDKLEDGPDYRINDYVSNLMNTVLDFQMKVGPIESKIIKRDIGQYTLPCLS